MEIAKYTAKESDYLINQSVFDIFYKALSGRRLIVFNQLFREINNLYKKYLKLDGPDKKKYTLHEFFEDDNTEYVYSLLYK